MVLVTTRCRLLQQSSRYTHRLERASQMRRKPAEALKPTVFYESTRWQYSTVLRVSADMYTGTFDKVSIVKKHLDVDYDAEVELRKMTAGISLIMGIETTLGLWMRGILAGLSMIALVNMYGGCSRFSFSVLQCMRVGSI